MTKEKHNQIKTLQENIYPSHTHQLVLVHQLLMFGIDDWIIDENIYHYLLTICARESSASFVNISLA